EDDFRRLWITLSRLCSLFKKLGSSALARLSDDRLYVWTAFGFIHCGDLDGLETFDKESIGFTSQSDSSLFCDCDVRVARHHGGKCAAFLGRIAQNLLATLHYCWNAVCSFGSWGFER